MMTPLKEKLHVLIDKTNDPVVLESLYRLLNDRVDNENTDILDELSPAQLNSLNESIGEYRKGELKSHAEILQLLKEWRSK